jgi:predicted molibdopterin-dependent oxidoreductase YjgC
MDGREISFEPGQTILEAGEEHGIHIPTLCFLKGASPTGACRICLVELEGAKTLVAACATPAAANMVVRTDSPRVVNARRLNLELLLASGHHNCLARDGDPDSWTDTQLHAMTAKGHEDLCPAYGSCRLQDLAIRYQASGRRLTQYHTRTQTGRCEGLDDILGEETADISPEDAMSLNINDGEKIKVRSRRGQVLVKARLTREVPQGMVWMSFHFRENCGNWLTNPVFDPITLTAEYKACAVRIEKPDGDL